MHDRRAVTLPTIDCGEVTLSCPPWCFCTSTSRITASTSRTTAPTASSPCPEREGPGAGTARRVRVAAVHRKRPLARHRSFSCPWACNGDHDPSDVGQKPRAMADTLSPNHAAPLRSLADELAGLLAGGWPVRYCYAPAQGA